MKPGLVNLIYAYSSTKDQVPPQSNLLIKLNVKKCKH